MSWEPKRGERVIAVLPDGHEIECVLGWSDGYLHRVYFDHLDGALMARVRTVKPVPVEEPKTFGACVKDRHGVRWVRLNDGRWYTSVGGSCEWRFIKQPLTIVNADPWS